ncbi:MAG TPA: serine hydrolase domain-containing protein [Kofleriaceae bacterium]|nr:serine hydrolase domain-containing protein [Kofleriaceae bacterium]
MRSIMHAWQAWHACLAGLVGLAGCASPATPARPAVFAIGDATVAAPPRWEAEQRADRVTFTDPDRALRVTIVANVGADAASAIAAAWQLAAPGFALAPGEPEEMPDSGDWDAVTTIEYRPPASQHRTVFARWCRVGTHRFVVLVDGDSAAFDRREADVKVLEGSLRAPGMREQALGARHPLDARRLDGFVQRALAELEVPGAAVAVIDGGKVVYERTFGVRALGDPAPVTVDTRFLIASITKPMTTLMEAALVDAGLVGWETPVVSVLPTFAIGDPEVTRELRLWHMSCACTGMPRQDLEDLFEWDGVTPEARLAAMRTMRPTTKLGETFQYSNLMVSAGGFIAAHAFAPERPLGEAYALAMQAKVFGPIGMTSTTLDHAEVARGDHAVPHALAIDGTTRAMPLAIERGVEPIAPAGGVWTTVRDMERYVITELGDGVTPEGVRVVSDANMRERLRVRVRSSATGGYGLGIGVGTYGGTRVIAHDGGSMGFGTTMFTLPAEHVGIIIFTNVRNGGPAEQLPFNAAVTRRIVELMFDGAVALADKKLAFYVKLRHRQPRVASPDHRWVAPLAGTYHDPALGDVVIRATADGADLDAGEWHVGIDQELDRDGTVKLVVLDPPFAGGAWIVGPGPSLLIPGYPGYRFTRVAPADPRVR